MESLTRSVKNNIPNIFTMMNLLSGCMAILLSFHDLALAGVLVLLAGFFDFADGLAARLFNAYSDFGKELDSLADMVSFGVAPTFILFRLIQLSLLSEAPVLHLELLTGIQILILSSSFLPAAFAAIRLARFNTSGGEGSFSGLPSPASGIFFASLGYTLLTTDTGWIQVLLLNTWMLLAINFTISILMVTTMPMFTIKFRNFRFAENKARYYFSIPSFIVFIVLGIKAIPLIIIYYIILSALMALFPQITGSKP
jgi:CDP-diacylglycerol---serine O-phosphatidyltransferase